MIKILHEEFDGVINSKYFIGTTNYTYALEKMFPLINNLDIQRNIQNKAFYARLEGDIMKHCIMPPITLSFTENNEDFFKDPQVDWEQYINDNISRGFVLDGIQRLSTLHRAFKSNQDFTSKVGSTTLYLNIIICSDVDKLLYRMITLNNGQKAMSARHQIEILMGNIFKFEDTGLDITTEKRQHVSSKYKVTANFKQADFVKAYLAFVSGTAIIDNNKIISDKLDELIAEKIMDSESKSESINFSKVIDVIQKLIVDQNIEKWFKVSNNLIGFCAAMKKRVLKNEEISDFGSLIAHFENVFGTVDVSKVKLGVTRRKAVQFYFEKLDSKGDYSDLDFANRFTDL